MSSYFDDDRSVYALDECERLNSLDLTYVEPLSQSVGMEFFDEIVENISEAEFAVLKAAHFYVRKNSYSTTRLGDPISTSYGSEDDPVVVEIRFEIPQHSESGKKLVKNLSESLKREKLEAERKVQEEAHAKAIEDLKKAQEALENAELALRLFSS